ncbi:hypothetical protein ACH5RR_006513 [Cinchona calisaya]|uniref:Uncharacterized protein n=1 Tax=Cinchona calisaya TaxID=153742 RepID=A0ABD3API0_9GENT
MPYELSRLYTGFDETNAECRKNVRTCNNSLAFSSLGVKYDHDLTKNTKGVYTFHLYFFDTEEEVSKRLDASPKLREITMKLLMNVLAENPYAKFFKGLRNIPNIEEKNIVLNSNLGLDQRVHNLPSTSQVAAIWTKSDDQNLDKSVHIQL